MQETERGLIKDALHVTQLFAPHEHKAYGLRRQGYFSYEATFASVLDGKSIQEVIREAKARIGPDHPQVAGADVMGSGWVFLRGSIFHTFFAKSLFDKGLDYGIGIALNNSRGSLRRFWDRKRGRDLDFVKGDVQLHSTWKKVDELLAKRNIDGFDVMLVRGIAGADDLSPLLITSSLKDAYARLTSHNGILLAQVPGFIGEGILRKFADTARDHNVGVQLGRGKSIGIFGSEVRVMRIDKFPTSPQKLDFI